MMVKNYFAKAVETFAQEHCLLDKGSKHIVAFSGGADSTALLLVMQELGYDIEAAHCNFHLRGAESDRDEEFCINLCQKLSIPLHRIHFDTREYASLHKVSIEMAARQLRYHYFEQLRQDTDARDILVAHHKEDNVETVLINLIRGTGLHGLAGIRPINGFVKRPLLDVSRQDIEDYLQSVGQDFVTDSTNLVNDVMRNKIRLDILPMLREINPSIADTIHSTSRHLTEAGKIVDDSLERFLTNRKEIVCYLSNDGADGTQTETGADIDIEALQKYPSPEYALYFILQKYDFTGVQSQQIFANLNAPSGKTWLSSTHELVIDRRHIIIIRKGNDEDNGESHKDGNANGKVMRIPETGTYIYDDDHRFKFAYLPMDGFQLSKSADTASLDASKVKFPLTIRRTRTGDRFTPFGMNGSKLVSDFLTDRKMNVFDKRRQLVITDATERIVWIAGLRPDNHCRIDSNTTRVLTISIDNQNNQ